MRRIAPKYVRNLEALGVDKKQLWDEKELRFLKRKELIQKVGEEEFKVLETIGRTIREGRWKGQYKTEVLKDSLKEVLGDELPKEVADFLKESEVDSLKFHYIKRKYLDGWNMYKPEDLDAMFTQHIRNPKATVYKQGERLILDFNGIVAIIEPPNKRISIYKLEEGFRTYEEFAIAKGWNKFTIKLWQLEQKLRLL